VQEALRLLRQREAPAPAQPPAQPAADEEPVELELTEEDTPAAAGWTPYGAEPAAPQAARDAPEVARPPAPQRVAPEPVRAVSAPTGGGVDDPAHLFDDLLAAPNVRGALLLDARGLVLAGSLSGGQSGDDAGAILGGAVDEAMRTVEFLQLGEWKGLLMESADAVLHVRPIADQGIAVLAVAPESPTGWILRTASTLATRAARYLEVPT
jgi:predicted regulator of Ras-like GTPase activity (Roadblock/LC7/MglB family)